MALRISITVNDASDTAVKNRFGVKLMEALSEFDSTTSVQMSDDSVVPNADRSEALVLMLQNVFGMSRNEALATLHSLEDKRISKLMAAKGLVTS